MEVVALRLALALSVLLAGCSLDRTPLLPDVPEDVGAVPDVPGLDAPRPDVPGLDAPLPDVPGLDAPMLDVPVPDVPGLDVPAPDVPPVPVDAPLDTGMGCVAIAETCNRVDDDCDGTIDESVCGACVALTVSGTGYLSCPGPFSGMEAWVGACRTAARGYDLVVFDDAAEQNRVQAALMAASITDPHWVGLNDFDTSGTYVWRDRVSAYRPTVPGTDTTKRFVVFRIDRSYEELTATDERRVLCEAVARPGACAGAESSCNGVDEDCDGRVDEGQSCGAGCSSSTFWDSVYYACSAGTATAAPDRCRMATGSALATLDSRTENDFLNNSVTPEVWIGLTQTSSSLQPDEGWSWTSPSGYGLPPSEPPWDAGSGGQPDDGDGTENNLEDCASMRTDGDFEDNACTDSLAILCERAWSY